MRMMNFPQWFDLLKNIFSKFTIFLKRVKVRHSSAKNFIQFRHEREWSCFSIWSLKILVLFIEFKLLIERRCEYWHPGQKWFSANKESSDKEIIPLLLYYFYSKLLGIRTGLLYVLDCSKWGFFHLSQKHQILLAIRQTGLTLSTNYTTQKISF